MKIESNSKHSVIAERYVDIKAVSKYTSLPVKTLYEWSGTGRIPSIKIGRKVLFDLKDIDKMMESKKRTCNKEEEIDKKIIEKFLDSDI